MNTNTKSINSCQITVVFHNTTSGNPHISRKTHLAKKALVLYWIMEVDTGEHSNSNVLCLELTQIKFHKSIIS